MNILFWGLIGAIIFSGLYLFIIMVIFEDNYRKKIGDKKLE